MNEVEGNWWLKTSMILAFLNMTFWTIIIAWRDSIATGWGLSIAIELFLSSLKTQVKVILKRQKCLSEPDHKFPRDKGQTLAFLSPSLYSRNTDWVSDGSAKLVENNFDVLKMSKKIKECSNGQKKGREDFARLCKDSGSSKQSRLKQKLTGCGASVPATNVSIQTCNKK